MHVVAIVAAGGRGERLGTTVPKQLLRIGGGTILQRSVDAFDASPLVGEIIVVLPPELAGASGHVRATAKPLRLVAGGPRRQDSVANGFADVPPEADLVIVHDAARPLVGQDLIARTIAAAAEHGAAIAALPVRDTVKQAARGGGAPFVEATLPRDAIFLAQTPQAFRRDILRRAIELGRAGGDATDEAVLAERAGFPVCLVDGDPRNLKITTEQDLAVARALIGGSFGSGLRVGAGYDLHRLVEGRPLVLGGVVIPSDRGLLGHSDADALSHAVTDAILGAAAAGDIGRHFPDSDPAWKDASSLDLLGRALAIVRERGFVVENVDAVVVAERPRLAPHADRIVASLAAILALETGRVSVKAKTNEGLGEIGRGEAIAVHAVAMLRSE